MTDPDGDAVVSDLSCIPRDSMRTWDRETKRAKGVIPALVVETLAPSTRDIDRKDKVAICHEEGVAECRIVDRREEAVRIYRFADEREKPVAVQSFIHPVTARILSRLFLETPRLR